MRFAALETSTDWCSVALYCDGGIACVEQRAPNRHSELALPMLDGLLKKAQLAPADLDAVAFGAGPGSFTGLRIACGLAQGLALARDLPVLGVSTLEAMAEESGAQRVVACLDARMHEVFFAALVKRDGLWHEVVPAQCAPPQAVAFLEGDWVGCGSGFAVYGSLGLSRVLPEVHPSALAVARLAAPRLAAGEGVDAAQAAPRYLRDKVAFTRAELDERRP